MILHEHRQCRYPTELVFFFNDTATTEIYTLSLHDALPIWNFLSRAPVSHRDGCSAKRRSFWSGRSLWSFAYAHDREAVVSRAQYLQRGFSKQVPNP